MTDIAIDETTGDLQVEGNNLVLIEGADEVTQRLRANLRTIRGEWFADAALGTPYREIIWVKGVSPTRVASAIKRVILTTPGVLELLSYRQELDTSIRKLTVQFKAKATDGDIVDFTEELDA